MQLHPPGRRPDLRNGCHAWFAGRRWSPQPHRGGLFEGAGRPAAELLVVPAPSLRGDEPPSGHASVSFPAACAWRAPGNPRDG